MSKIRFLLDENMPHAVRDQLLLNEPNIEFDVLPYDPKIQERI